jgi:hypothetical protein
MTKFLSDEKARADIANCTKQLSLLQKQAIPVAQTGVYKRYIGVKGNTLYIADGANLYKSTDRGSTLTLINGGSMSVDKVYPLISGAMLAVKRGDNDSCKIYRSADGETSWTEVASLEVAYMEQGICQDSVTEKIYLGSYVTGASTCGDIYCSQDDGLTWNVIQSIESVKHIHCILEDPYNPGTLYLCAGDTNEQSKIIKTSNGFTDITVVGSGSQQWRTVSLIFKENYIFWAMDSTVITEPPYIVKMNRQTKEVERLLRINAPGYYSLALADGGMLFATTPENALTTTVSASNIYYSPDDGETWGLLYSHLFPNKSYYIIYIAGQADDGTVYFYLTASLTERYGLGVQIIDKAMINTPYQHIEPMILQYNMNANGKDISNIVKLTGKNGSPFHISASNDSIYLGYLNDSNGVILSHRSTDHLKVDSNGVSLVRNGGGIIFKSAEGTKYKLTVNNSGEAVFTLVP